VGEPVGTGDCEGDGVGVTLGEGVGVGEDVGYAVVADQPLYPWRVHKARARTEYEPVLEPRLYSTVKVVVL
jgi:hypothetical protein